MNLTFLKSKTKSWVNRMMCLTEALSLPMTDKKIPIRQRQHPERRLQSLSEFLLNPFVAKWLVSPNRNRNRLTLTMALKKGTKTARG